VTPPGPQGAAARPAGQWAGGRVVALVVAVLLASPRRGSPPAGPWRCRVRVTGADPATPLFVGIARTQDAVRYLAGIRHDTVSDLAGASGYRAHPGGAPELAPSQQAIWVAQSSGTGTRTIAWPMEAGSWTVVVTDADGRQGVDVRADVGAKLPALEWVAAGLLATGLVLLATAVVLLVLAVRSPAPASTP
jgi:hypothetical protein